MTFSLWAVRVGVGCLSEHSTTCAGWFGGSVRDGVTLCCLFWMTGGGGVHVDMIVLLHIVWCESNGLEYDIRTSTLRV